MLPQTSAALVLLMSLAAVAEDRIGFDVKPTIAVRELNPRFCWFHPRAAAIPKLGKNGLPTVIMTIQKHLIADDHYSGLWFMRSDDLGRTWIGPTEIPELAWRTEPGNHNVHLSVADVTPQWHAKTGKLIALGIQVRYDAKGVQLNDQSRSYDFAYTVFDPNKNSWTKWRNVENVPDANGHFYSLAPGCVQSVIKDDGTLLVPVYVGKAAATDYQTTVLHLDFDGDSLKYLEHGDVLRIDGGRGYYEPSIAFFRQKYYLTLRHDHRAFVTVSDDGQHFGPIHTWMFDDGAELGSYNTQAHWLVHRGGLFLSYTRKGANNDHIPRNRAPIFLAQVDPNKLHVIRATEREVLPERGVMLGNFGASNITPDESWITDSEFINNGQKHARGADGTTWVGKIRWSSPNSAGESSGEKIKIVTLGDSITKAVREGVRSTETFTWNIGANLRARGMNAETVNVGIGGEQTNGALARLERDVLSQQPNFVTVMYGTNDSYQYAGEKAPRLTTEQYQQNLEQIVERLRANHIEPILMTPPRWGRGAKNGVGADPNILLEPYVAICREVAKNQKVKLVDHYQIWSDAEASGIDIGQWTTDLCHPNPEGQEKMADAILGVL